MLYVTFGVLIGADICDQKLCASVLSHVMVLVLF